MLGSSFFGSREPRRNETRRYSFLEEDNTSSREGEKMNKEIDRLMGENPSRSRNIDSAKPREEKATPNPIPEPVSEPKVDTKPATNPEPATKPATKPDVKPDQKPTEIPLQRPSFLDQPAPFAQKPQAPQKTSDVTNDYEKFFSLMGQFSRFAEEIENAKRVEKVWFLGKKPYSFAEYTQITGEEPSAHRARYVFVDDKNTVLGEATERDFTLWKYHNNPPIPRLLGFTYEA